MKAGILAIGTELLMGQTVNTNATYLSKELGELGVGVYYHLTVGDNPQRIKNALDDLLASCDLVLVTGGLGPTLDDKTKEVFPSLRSDSGCLIVRCLKAISDRPIFLKAQLYWIMI